MTCSDYKLKTQRTHLGFDLGREFCYNSLHVDFDPNFLLQNMNNKSFVGINGYVS
jgi:hypothetical protein